MTSVKVSPLLLLAAVLLLLTTVQRSCGVEAQECKLINGTVVPGMMLGDDGPLGEGCADCFCMENGQAYCTYSACLKPSCWDSSAASSFCCPSCGHGRNCKTPGGTIVTEGQHVIEDGQNCTCSDFTCGEGCDGPAATCHAFCRLENGTSIPGVDNAGDIWKSADGCLRCTCQSSGEVTCKNISPTCTEPDCEDAFYQKGRCCKICPADAGICVLAHTYHVTGGETVGLTNDTRCECPSSLTLSCFTPTAADLEAEQKEIEKLKDRVKDLRKKIFNLENAIRKINYPKII